MGNAPRIIEIAAGGSMAEARMLLRTAEEARYTVALLRKFSLSADELAQLQAEFQNPLVLVVLPEFRTHATLYFARDVSAGEMLTADAVTTAPPLRGLTPPMLPKMLNRKVLYDMKQGEPITFGVIDL